MTEPSHPVPATAPVVPTEGKELVAKGFVALDSEGNPSGDLLLKPPEGPYVSAIRVRSSAGEELATTTGAPLIGPLNPETPMPKTASELAGLSASAPPPAPKVPAPGEGKEGSNITNPPSGGAKPASKK